MKFVRYLIVQLAAYGLDMGGFLIALHLLALGPITSNVAGKILAGAFAFFAHRGFTFGVHKTTPRTGQAIRYFILLLLNVPLSSAVLAIILSFIAYPVPAKLLSDGLCVAITFTLSKYLVFEPRGSGNNLRKLKSNDELDKPDSQS